MHCLDPGNPSEAIEIVGISAHRNAGVDVGGLEDDVALADGAAYPCGECLDARAEACLDLVVGAAAQATAAGTASSSSMTLTVCGGVGSASRSSEPVPSGDPACAGTARDAKSRPAMDVSATERAILAIPSG